MRRMPLKLKQLDALEDLIPPKDLSVPSAVNPRDGTKPSLIWVRNLL